MASPTGVVGKDVMRFQNRQSSRLCEFTGTALMSLTGASGQFRCSATQVTEIPDWSTRVYIIGADGQQSVPLYVHRHRTEDADAVFLLSMRMQAPTP